jgi:hypothetical protein
LGSLGDSSLGTKVLILEGASSCDATDVDEPSDSEISEPKLGKSGKSVPTFSFSNAVNC